MPPLASGKSVGRYGSVNGHIPGTQAKRQLPNRRIHTRDPEATLDIVLIVRPLPPSEQSLITKGLAGLPRLYSLLRLLLDFLLQQLQLFKQGVPQTMECGQLRKRIHISTV